MTSRLLLHAIALGATPTHGRWSGWGRHRSPVYLRSSGSRAVRPVLSEHPGGCVDGKALDGATGVAVSPNGLSVYVASGVSDAVAVFDRSSDRTVDPTGRDGWGA